MTRESCQSPLEVHVRIDREKSLFVGLTARVQTELSHGLISESGLDTFLVKWRAVDAGHLWGFRWDL